MIGDDFYRILGVSKDASIYEMTEAYRKLAFQYHPDRNQMSPAAHERMKEINDAYYTLCNSTRRKEYELSGGCAAGVPMFNTGSKVRVRSDSALPHSGRTGVVEREPIKDYFRFWYTVKLESRGLATVLRFAEEQLEKVGD